MAPPNVPGEVSVCNQPAVARNDITHALISSFAPKRTDHLIAVLRCLAAMDSLCKATPLLCCKEGAQPSRRSRASVRSGCWGGADVIATGQDSLLNLHQSPTFSPYLYAGRRGGTREQELIRRQRMQSVCACNPYWHSHLPLCKWTVNDVWKE